MQNLSSLYRIAWVVNEKGNYYTGNLGTIYDEKFIVKKRPWYTVALKTKGVIYTEPYIDYATNKTVITSVEAIWENKNVIGFVGIDIILDTIPNIFKNFKIGKEGKAFLITQNGDYVYREDLKNNLIENIKDDTDELAKIGNSK